MSISEVHAIPLALSIIRLEHAIDSAAAQQRKFDAATAKYNAVSCPVSCAFIGMRLCLIVNGLWTRCVYVHGRFAGNGRVDGAEQQAGERAGVC